MHAVRKWIAALEEAIRIDDPKTIKDVLKDAIPEFKRRKPAPQPVEPVQQARLASS